jgi:hypothetical protein
VTFWRLKLSASAQKESGASPIAGLDVLTETLGADHRLFFFFSMDVAHGFQIQRQNHQRQHGNNNNRHPHDFSPLTSRFAMSMGELLQKPVLLSIKESYLKWWF